MFRKSIIIIIVIVSTLLITFLLILPKKEVLSNLEKKIQEREQELKIRDDYSKELESISTGLEDYQDQLAKIKLALPEGSQPLVFYNFLQKSASRAGLVLKAISHNEEPGAIYLNLAVSGNTAGFINFLSILEKSARMINIESFSFSSPEKEKDPVDFNLKIKAYFLE